MKDTSFLSLSFPGPGGTIEFENPNAVEGGLSKGAEILQTGITLFLVIGIVLVVFFIIWSGYQWISSSGDKQKVHAAKMRLTYAIVGLLVMFFCLVCY